MPSSEVPTGRSLQALLEPCPLGVMALDGDGRVLWANRALGNLLGQAPERLVGLRAGRCARAELAGLLSEAVRFDVSDGAGTVRHLQRTRVPLTGAGEVAELHYITDLTERLRAEAQCEALRHEVEGLRLQDAATGLMSRRALMLALEPQVSRSRRYDNPLAVVMLQVGFVPGAEAPGARAVAHLLKDQLRWADLVARGDDGAFVLVLPESGRDAAVSLADKVAGALKRDERVCASYFGITEWNRADDAKVLLARAQAALAQAHAEQGAGRASL